MRRASMTLAGGLAVLSVIAAPACSQTVLSVADAHQSGGLLIRGATLVSPQSEQDGRVADVLVEDGRIVAIGAGLPQTGHQVIEATGLYLTPGLIDGHVHLYHATGLRRRDTDAYEALRRAYDRQLPRSYLFHGFTTVVELNADPDTNARFEAAPDHPQLLHCGPGIVLPDGFMALEAPEGQVTSVFPAVLHDPYGRDTLLPGMNARDHTPDAVLDVVEAAGGRCVKLFYEEARWWPGGVPDFALPSLTILREMTAAAHARGLPVFLHATTPTGIEIGMAAGVDAFAHGPWEWPQDGFAASRPGPQTRETMQALAVSGIGVQSTIRTLANTRSLFQPGLLNDPAWRDVVPDEMLAHLRTGTQVQREQFLARFVSVLLEEGGEASDMPVLQDNFLRRYRTLLAQFSLDGGRLLFGIDTAVGGFGWGAPPGLAGYWEMRDWEEAGLSPRTILAAATVENARLFGLGDRVGQIAPGYEADLLLFAADPRVSVAAFETLEVIILGGRPIERSSLSALRLD